MPLRAACGAHLFLLIWWSRHLQRWLKYESRDCSYYCLHILHSRTKTLKHTEMGQEEGLKHFISYSYPRAIISSQGSRSCSISCRLDCFIQHYSSPVRSTGLWPVSQFTYNLESGQPLSSWGTVLNIILLGNTWNSVFQLHGLCSASKCSYKNK